MLAMFRKTTRVILAIEDPEALAVALQLLEGQRVSYEIAPTTDALAALLRRGPARVVLHPSLREGKVPRAHLDGVLSGAVPFEVFQADPEGVIRSGTPQRLTALPAGLYLVVGCAGGVGATTAARGLHEALRRGGEAAALLELPGPGRPAPGLSEARDGVMDLTGPLAAGHPLPWTENGHYALHGWTVAELFGKTPGAIRQHLEELRAAFRLVVVDLSPDSPVAESLAKEAVRTLLLLDLRPEAEVLANRLAGTFPRPLRVLVARWGEAGGIPHEVRLDPPPHPERWGKVLVRALLAHLF
jgi:hypothetical protein